MSKKQSNPSGRTFTIAVRPELSKIEQLEIINQLNGVAIVWSITHDKDIDENGAITSPHTHFLIDYKTPRRVSTVANIFGVENNHIELVRNKHGMIRYLTHLDDDEKYQYDPDDVLTNDKITYLERILSSELTNSDIVNYFKQGRGLELIDIVPPAKLRAIQSLLAFDNSNALQVEIRALRDDISVLQGSIDTVNRIAGSFLDGLEHTAKDLSIGMKAIATEMSKSTKMMQSRSVGRRVK